MNLRYLCLQIVVNKPEDLKQSSTTDKVTHDGNKSDLLKAKEGKGKPSAISKSGSTHDTVIFQYLYIFFKIFLFNLIFYFFPLVKLVHLFALNK